MGTIKRNFANNLTTNGKFDATDLSGTIPASNIDNNTVSAVTALPSSLGDAIESTASDPVSPSEGQIWYNSSEGKVKIYALTSASWAAGGNLGTASYARGTAGTQTSSLTFGGTAGPAYNSNSESYNGTSWTATPSLNTGRFGVSGAGVSNTSAVAFGGYVAAPTTYSAATELFNGSSWTNSGNLNTGRAYLSGCGIQTSALAFGGSSSPPSTFAYTESFNGSTWTALNALNTGRFGLGGAGTQTAALAFGGGPPRTSATESWNGTSWTTVSSLPAIVQNTAGFGIQTLAVSAGGANVPNAGVATTNVYNGTSWNASTNLSTARSTAGGAGTNAAGLVSGGGTNLGSGPVLSATEEFTGSQLQTKTVTVS